jgi:TonB family protein
MTLSERGNYRIAVLVSILFHIALLLIYFPTALSNKMKIETVGAGLVDLSGGGDPLQKETVESPVIESTKQLPAEPPIQNKQVKSKPIEQPAPAVPVQTKKGVAIVTKPSDKQPQVVEKEGATGTSRPSAGGNNPVQKPASIALGDGSGMIAGMGGGSKLQAPKNVQNEDFEGEVTLRILVKADGTVEDIHFFKKSGDDRLDNSTQKIIRREWKFKTNPESYEIDVSFDYRKDANYYATYRFINAQTRP